MASLATNLRTALSQPSSAIGYIFYRAGFNSVTTAFGGRLWSTSYSELKTTRNLALSERELQLIQMLPARGHIFDVGAHVGIWTIPLALARRHATVHAFEAAAPTFRQLKNNVSWNELTNVLTVHAAVCDRIGTVKFQVPDNASVFGRISSLGNSRGRYSRASEMEVPSTTLIDYCKKHGVESIEFLKIDVEGAEVDVLRGLWPMLLRRQVQLIWIEIDEINQLDFSHSISELAALLDECRYGVYRLSNLEMPIDITVEHDGNMMAKPL